MPLSRVPLARLTSWPTSGLAGVSGLAPGYGSSGTATTPCLPLRPPDLSLQREHVPPGSDLHSDHLSLAVPVTLPAGTWHRRRQVPCHPCPGAGHGHRDQPAEHAAVTTNMPAAGGPSSTALPAAGEKAAIAVTPRSSVHGIRDAD
jgi:hypothetical protein